MSRLPMPPGYTPTVPVGGGESPHPEPGEIRFVVEPPAPSWWRENHAAILAALGLTKPKPPPPGAPAEDYRWRCRCGHLVADHVGIGMCGESGCGCAAPEPPDSTCSCACIHHPSGGCGCPCQRHSGEAP